MGLQELILEAIKELGDPDELVNNEDLIVLKLDQASPNKRILPEDIGLSGDARRLNMSQQAFVACRAFLGNLRYSAALFAGCNEFMSSKAFFETAKYVLKNVRTLVFVHNRNSIFNLVSWFPTVTTIVLYHNLRMHSETGVVTSTFPLSRLEQLLGTMPILGLDHLSMSTHSLQSLFNKCPKLALVMSSNVEPALSANKVMVTFTPKRLPLPIRRKALFEGNTCIHYTGIPIQFAAVSADAVEKAREYFAEAYHLELTAACESAIGKVASYPKVTHLSLVSAMPKNKSPFEPRVTEVLSVLRLVHLSLTHFSGVRLSVIAKLCPQLKFLEIRACSISDEEDTAANFSSLEQLRLGSAMKKESLFTLLKSCPGLRELEIDKDELTAAFVAGPGESCEERPILERVERLTLRTNADWFDDTSLDDVDDLPSDLHVTLSRLPSLRRVRTDNYDIRFHINSCFPNIALDWCTCTLCASEFPKMGESQGDMYRCVLQLKLPSQIEYVHINVQDKTRAYLKAEVSVNIKEEEMEVEEVVVDTTDNKKKAVEATIDIKGEKVKERTPISSKEEEVNAEVTTTTKEEKMRTEAPTNSTEEVMKAEVVPVCAKDNDMKAEEVKVDIKEGKIKADEVAFETKEGEWKEEVSVDLGEEKSKAENVPVNTKEDKMEAAALVRTKEELMKTETPVDPYKGTVKVEVILVDANGEQVKEEHVQAYIMKKKLKGEDLEDYIEKEMKPLEILQKRYEARIRERRRRLQARSSKTKEMGIADSEEGTITKEDEVSVPLPSMTEPQALSEGEVGAQNTVAASELSKPEYKSLEEPD